MKVERLSESNLQRINDILKAPFIEIQNMSSERPQVTTLYEPYLDKKMGNNSDSFTIKDRFDYKLDITNYEITYDSSSILINSVDSSVCYLITCQESLGNRRAQYIDNMKQRYVKSELSDNPINTELIDNDSVADFIDDFAKAASKYDYDVFVNTLKLNVEGTDAELSIYYEDTTPFVTKEFDSLRPEVRLNIPNMNIKLVGNSYYEVLSLLIEELNKVM